MKFFSDHPVVIPLFIIMALCLAGSIFIFAQKFQNRNGKTEPAAGFERVPALSATKRNFLLLTLFSLIFCTAIVVLVNYLSVPPESAASAGAAASTATLVVTPTAAPAKPGSTSASQILRFDELEPIIPLAGNLSVNEWDDRSPFRIDDRTYSYGIGLFFSGTSAETYVEDLEDMPDQIFRDDCKEFSAEYALRKNYSKLTFSIGVDNGDPNHYGDEDTNGIAEVVLSDKDTGLILFDTEWVNYTYANYDATVDLSNVDVFIITYRTCGVNNKHNLTNGLRFVIVDPILELKDDAGE
ncbi:MAG: hypothetical protein LLF75_02875 [Eubacteriales bacterium]|nr:hypothetical protein [Eubacteriales bacterium]